MFQKPVYWYVSSSPYKRREQTVYPLWFL